MSSEFDPKNTDIPQSMMTAVRKVLRPLVRLLLNFRMTFPRLAEILKSVYVEVAEEEFRLPNKKQTDTRLSLLTGIHRKDIKRLRAQENTDHSTPANVDISTRIIARWIGEPNYLDDSKQPRILPFTDQPDELSFERLVEEVCKKDIRPRVVLDEWLNLGIATLHSDNSVSLNVDAFIPNKGFDEKAFFLGHNIADHLAAATDNLINDPSPFFERCVYYDGLSAESVQQLQEIIATKGMETLLEVNELAMKLKTQDAAKNATQSLQTERINIGLYAYHETEELSHND